MSDNTFLPSDIRSASHRGDKLSDLDARCIFPTAPTEPDYRSRISNRPRCKLSGRIVRVRRVSTRYQTWPN